MVFVMDFLDKHTLLDHVLVDEGVFSNDIAMGMGEFMGKTHAKTHSSKVSKERFDYLVKNFENRPMRDIQLDYVFTKCYKEATDEQKAGLNVDEAFMKEVEESAYEMGKRDGRQIIVNQIDKNRLGGTEDEPIVAPDPRGLGIPQYDYKDFIAGTPEEQAKEQKTRDDIFVENIKIAELKADLAAAEASSPSQGTPGRAVGASRSNRQKEYDASPAGIRKREQLANIQANIAKSPQMSPPRVSPRNQLQRTALTKSLYGQMQAVAMQ